MHETFDQNKDLLFRKHFHCYKSQEKGGLPRLSSLCRMNWQHSAEQPRALREQHTQSCSSRSVLWMEQGARVNAKMAVGSLNSSAELKLE